jgi:hypothetical protein
MPAVHGSTTYWIRAKNNPMNLKTLLPWLCVVALAGGLAFALQVNQKKDVQLAVLNERAGQVDTLRAQLADIQEHGTESQQAEIARLRKDNGEVLQLRNEVQQLQGDNQQLKQQAAVMQAEAQQTPSAPQLQQLQAENQQLRASIDQDTQRSMMNTCINNLRQIDGAKQQWALENKMPDTAVPTAADIAPYLKDNVVPQCPAGGVYTIGAVGTDPTCSIPGHVLPKP